MLTWIMVANRGGAKIFVRTGRREKLRLLKDIPHPAGRLHGTDLNSDRPGRSFSNASPLVRHAYSDETTPEDHAAEIFSKTLATILDKGAQEDSFDRLVLIADARFLGHLRSILRNHTRNRLIMELDKNLLGATTEEIDAQLALAA